MEDVVGGSHLGVGRYQRQTQQLGCRQNAISMVNINPSDLKIDHGKTTDFRFHVVAGVVY